MRATMRAAVASVTVALTLSVAGLRAAPALAARGQTTPEATSTTYTVRDDGTVRVDVGATIASRESCPAGYVCYFDAMVLAVPTAAANITSDGGSVATEARGRFFQLAVVRLASRLTTGQTRTVHVTYDITSGPRANPFVRTNPAYVQFYAFATGNPGRVDVTINVPSQYDVSVDFANMERSTVGSTTVLRQSGIADPDKWSAAITARNNRALVQTRLTVAGHKIVVRSWPGDDEWARYVVGQVRRGIPTLERLVARPLPKRGALAITEAAAPYLYGYAGWYTASDNAIEVGDDLDASVVLHEISHEWFNRDVFDDRWVNEGLAQELSTRAIGASDGGVAGPTRPSAGDPGQLELDKWSHPDFQSSISDAQERYGYNTSFWVMRELADEIGARRFRTVVDAALNGDYAYRANGRPERDTSGIGWRQLLDLLDSVGGSRRADALFSRYVVSPSARAELAQRAKARARYARLATASGAWGVPLAVRTSMHDWNFAAANSHMDVAFKILALRASIEQRVARFDVTLPTTIATRYAGDRDLAPLLVDLQALGSVADGLVAAHAKVAAARSVFERIGLIGEDPDGALARADRSFTQGDARGASTSLTAATTTVDAASSRGRTRALMAGVVLLTVAGVFVLVVLFVRARRRRPIAPPPPSAADDPSAVLVTAGGAAAGAHDDPVGFATSTAPPSPPPPPDPPIPPPPPAASP